MAQLLQIRVPRPACVNKPVTLVDGSTLKFAPGPWAGGPDPLLWGCLTGSAADPGHVVVALTDNRPMGYSVQLAPGASVNRDPPTPDSSTARLLFDIASAGHARNLELLTAASTVRITVPGSGLPSSGPPVVVAAVRANMAVVAASAAQSAFLMLEGLLEFGSAPASAALSTALDLSGHIDCMAGAVTTTAPSLNDVIGGTQLGLRCLGSLLQGRALICGSDRLASRPGPSAIPDTLRRLASGDVQMPRGLLLRLGHGGGRLGNVGVEQRAAHVGDVDDADQAGVADDRQVPEMAARHDLGRVTDACGGVDHGRASGHQGMDPRTVHVLSVGDRVGNVRFGDDACRLAGLGVQDHQSGRARVLHQVGGRSDVVALFYRRQRWPHDVCGGGRGGGVGLLGHLFYLYLSAFTFRWVRSWALAVGQECSPRPGIRLHVIRRPRRLSGQGWSSLGLEWQYRSGSPRPLLQAAFADWWKTTASDRLARIPAPALDHRYFWDAMHAVTLE